MPKKNTSDELKKKLAYCKELEKLIESDQALSLVTAVKEKLSLLKETAEETHEHFCHAHSKDTDANAYYFDIEKCKVRSIRG